MAGTVNAEARALLEAVTERPWIQMQAPEQHRVGRYDVVALTGPPRALVNVVDTHVADVAVRVYHPTRQRRPPAVVFCHGGGWVLGDFATADTTARDLAHHAQAVVVSVNYRRPPRHPFPAAFDDALAVTRALLDNTAGLGIAAERVAVSGDSAGGNLAAAVALALRGHPRRLRHQALIYPVTQVRVGSTPSYWDFAEGYLARARDIHWCLQQYAPTASWRDPRLAPLEVRDLTGAAAASVVLAECDPLRDEGARYAERLRAAGTAVSVRTHQGQIHSFVYFAGVCPQDADCARRFVGSELRAALHRD